MEGDPKDFKDYDYNDFARKREEIEINNYKDVDDNIEREEETIFLEPEPDVNIPTVKPDIEWDKTYDEIDLDNIPNPQKDLADQRRVETSEKKDFLLNFLKFNVVKKNGPNSKELLEKFSIRLNQAGKVLGGIFEGVNIIIRVGDKFFYSSNKKIQESINKFKELSKKANAEYFGTLSAQIEENIDTQDMSSDRLEEITSQISRDSLEEQNNELESYINSIETNIKDISFKEDEPTPNEILRTIRGYIYIPDSQTIEEKLENLENEANHWRLKKLQETDSKKEAVYDTLEKIANMSADRIRLLNDIRVDERDTQAILKKVAELNDLNRFEKYKKWAKNNLVGLSAIAITIGGIITTVVISA